MIQYDLICFRMQQQAAHDYRACILPGILGSLSCLLGSPKALDKVSAF